MTGRSPSGSRTARLSLRVDTLISSGPAAKPVLGLCRRPGRQRNFMAVVTAHPRALHGNLATMETDLSLGSAPAVADAASATIMRRAGELLRVIAKHLLDGSDSGRQKN